MLEHYYRILQIPEGSGEESIKKAYRKMALKMHPDINSSPDATEKFQDLCEAYEILLSQVSRAGNFGYSGNLSSEPGYNWEDVLREAREKAKVRARMRYERIRAEQELFEKGGWKDFIILIKYFRSIVVLTGAVWLLIWPVYSYLTNGSVNLYFLIFLWLTGFLLLTHIINKWESWFNPGILDFTISKIINYFEFSEFSDITTDCAFSKGFKGRGRPFKFSMLKVRDIKMGNDGPMQHYAHYKRTYKELYIPRSRKAFYVHFSLSVIKPLLITAGLIFIPFPGFIWRFFLGFFIASMGAGLILLIARTRSKVSFLLTPFLIIKIVIWLLVMMSQTYLHPGFILAYNDILILLIALMLVFLDMFLDLVLRAFPFYTWFYYPLPPQLPGVAYLFKKGYQTYLDLPVWSSLYPFFRWLI